MPILNQFNVHPRFKLNGTSLSNEDLLVVGYGYTKTGEDFEKSIGHFLLDWCNESDELVVKTSGSTGVPKHIHLLKKHMVNSALATGDFFNLEPGDTAFNCLPSNFIAGKMMLVRAMVLGLEIDCVAPSKYPLENNKKTYDFSAMVPLQLRNSLKDINCIKTLIVGGTPLTKNLKYEVQKKNTKVYETYGMTETITHVAVKKVNNFDDKDQSVVNPFRALPNVSFSRDKLDCLIIDAPKISVQKVVTNDIVDLISDTEFVWLGRHDNIINSGGIKLIPEQIENALAQVIRNRFFVAGVQDDMFGEKLILLVEGQKESDLLEKIKASKKLSKYELPKEIFFLAQFKETDTGKVNRSKTIKTLQR
ncbi:AMP-binding protein [Maribacter sp. 2210JD10-5]|uniref:AMP-binding protein n=1 Tax=Maribacter sp. 2210JD10-5 TaxID=3386272 RepID=UPI0039BCB67C